jgi:hypothetical protein
LQIGTTTAQKIGFFNATPIVQPVSTNVISALTNLGLIASTVTLGPVVTVGALSVFVANATTNVDITNRILAGSNSADASVDYGNRTLKVTLAGTARTALAWSAGAVTFFRGIAIDDSNGIALLSAISFGTSVGTQIGTTTSQKLAFYGSSAVVQPSNTNAVSGLISLGLLATGTTYGVLPQSVDTLTISTSISFGTIVANDQHYRDVVVTGAAVNDLVLLGLPTTVSGGAVVQGVAYKTNTVCISCSNTKNSSIDVPSATYRITVIGY